MLWAYSPPTVVAREDLGMRVITVLFIALSILPDWKNSNIAPVIASPTIIQLSLKNRLPYPSGPSAFVPSMSNSASLTSLCVNPLVS